MRKKVQRVATEGYKRGRQNSTFFAKVSVQRPRITKGAQENGQGGYQKPQSFDDTQAY